MLIATTRCSSASSRLNLARIVPKTWHSRRFAVAAYLRNAAPSVVPEIKPYYITTPIFYPNAGELLINPLKTCSALFAVPHIGHLYSLIIADTYARYARLVSPSRPVNFVTGTDEHGMKIQKAAQERDMVPQELCDLLGLAFQVSLFYARANPFLWRFSGPCTQSEDHTHKVCANIGRKSSSWRTDPVGKSCSIVSFSSLTSVGVSTDLRRLDIYTKGNIRVGTRSPMKPSLRMHK